MEAVLPAMYGTATLAIEVSITSMNVAIITASAISHGFTLPSDRRGSPHRSHTLGSTLIPGAAAGRRSARGFSRMRTGRRCTTFT